MRKSPFLQPTSLETAIEPHSCIINHSYDQNNEAYSSKQSSKQKEVDLINFSMIPQTGKDLKIDKETQIYNLQMKMLEEFLSTTQNTNQHFKNHTSEQEKQFRMFFDKYEADYLTANRKELKLDKANSLEFNADKISISTNIVYPKLEKLQLDDLNANEDLIDEIMQEKALQKILLQNSNYLHTSKNKHSPADSNTFLNNGDVLNKVKPDNDKNVTVSILNEKVCYETILNNNNITSNTNNINVNKHDIHCDQKENHKLHAKDKIKDLASKHNIKYLEAIKKDIKLFQKRSVLKSDTEKLHLTPGPTLYEKSVVLPQIMQRLTERNKEVEELSKMERKLVLDTGVPKYMPADEEKCSNKVLNTNPNINTHCKQANTLKAPTTFGSISMAISNPAKAYAAASNLKQIPANISKQTFKENKPSIGRDLTFTPVDKLRALRREQILSGQGSSREDCRTVNPPELNPPVELMGNCNKERFINYATSILFQDFVNGK